MVVITLKDPYVSVWVPGHMGLLSPSAATSLIVIKTLIYHWICLSLLIGSCWKKKESKVYVDGHRKYRVRLAPEKL